MSLRISCVFCEAKLTVRDDKAGQESKCPSCREMITARTEAASKTTAANNQNDGAGSGENQAAESFDEGSEGFNFAEEFDLEGLLPEIEHSIDDLSRMPPARKLTSRGKRGKPPSATNLAMRLRSEPRNIWTVCQKRLDLGVRDCTGCGHNNFVTDAAVADADLKIPSRMERLTASQGVARILKIPGPMFR